MIGWLKGVVRARDDDALLLDVQGVGYEVSVSLLTAAGLPPLGREVSLFVHTQVREDAISLFGFADAEERGAFRALVEVNGIGPRLALAVLSGLDPRALAQAIAARDLRRLSAIPGIGKKTAERLVLELKDKLPAGPAAGPGAEVPAAPWSAPAAAGAGGGALADLALALDSLGYRKAEIDRILKGIRPAEGDTVEGLLRRALKDLGPRQAP